MTRTKAGFFLLLIALLLMGCVAGKRTRTRRIESIIDAARTYIGTPYRYGGTSRIGMDCSGLLMVSFQNAGLHIPRTAKQQSKIGKKIRIDKIEPGDLVFFSEKRRRRKITHAGLVTAVRGNQSIRFIHASTQLGVVESELLTDYYQRIFVIARRPRY